MISQLLNQNETVFIIFQRQKYEKSDKINIKQFVIFDTHEQNNNYLL